MHRSIASTLLLGSALMLGCSPHPALSASQARAERPAPAVASPEHKGNAELQAFATSIGARCDDTATEPTCLAGDVERGDYFEVTLHVGCRPSDFTARVGAPTELRNKIAPLDDRTVAEAQPTDALCIEATGSIKQHPEYYYVVLQKPGNSCATNGGSKLDPAHCPAGWIDAEAVTTGTPH